MPTGGGTGASRSSCSTGVDVRPIRQMTGDHEFCRSSSTASRAEPLLGPERGWRVATEVLLDDGSAGRGWSASSAGSTTCEPCSTTRRRDQLLRLYVRGQALRTVLLRPAWGPAAASSAAARTELEFDIEELLATVATPRASWAAGDRPVPLRPRDAIAGGTSEIQRNIIAERASACRASPPPRADAAGGTAGGAPPSRSAQLGGGAGEARGRPGLRLVGRLGQQAWRRARHRPGRRGRRGRWPARPRSCSPRGGRRWRGGARARPRGAGRPRRDAPAPGRACRGGGRPRRGTPRSRTPGCARCTGPAGRGRPRTSAVRDRRCGDRRADHRDLPLVARHRRPRDRRWADRRAATAPPRRRPHRRRPRRRGPTT